MGARTGRTGREVAAEDPSHGFPRSFQLLLPRADRNTWVNVVGPFALGPITYNKRCLPFVASYDAFSSRNMCCSALQVTALHLSQLSECMPRSCYKRHRSSLTPSCRVILQPRGAGGELGGGARWSLSPHSCAGHSGHWGRVPRPQYVKQRFQRTCAWMPSLLRVYPRARMHAASTLDVRPACGAHGCGACCW